MELKFIEKESHLIISIEGKLDSFNAQQVYAKVEEKIKNSDSDIVFDLSNLEYMTSAGLQVLLMASKNRNSKGKLTYIYKPQRIVDYVLKVSGFYAFLKKTDNMPL